MKSWGLEGKQSQPMNQKVGGVVIVIHDELKSQPFKTIHYAYNEILEGLRCYEFLESVQTH